MTERDDDYTTGEEESFADLFAASEARQPRQRRQTGPGDLIRGRVIAIGANSAFIEIGAKGEAMIDVAELRDPATGELQFAVGDTIEATVVDDGATSGNIVVKRSAGRGGRAPGELEQALAHGLPVEGVVAAEVKGGFDIQLGNARAFCPGSQIDRRRGDPASYVGRRLSFRVTKIDNGGRNIVVSRRVLLDEEAAVEAARTWERIEVGAVLEGRVTSVRDFGAFVDLGGVEGLIHVSEFGHARVSHPSEVLQPDQSVQVKVIKVEQAGEGGRARIGLSMRALAPDPWTAARGAIAVGASLPGVVRRLEAFGAFIQIAPGVDGLAHVSKLALDRRVSHPRQVLAVGDTVEVTVLSIDDAQRRISLSMVEQARRERDAQEATARGEEEAALDRTNERKGLGTLAELLDGPKRTP